MKLCKSCAHTWRVVLWHLCRLFGRGFCYLSLADVIAVFFFYCVDVHTRLSADETTVRSRSLVCVWNDSNCVEFNESRKVSRFSLLKSFATYTSLCFAGVCTKSFAVCTRVRVFIIAHTNDIRKLEDERQNTKQEEE